jgi:hypothetical protein
MKKSEPIPMPKSRLSPWMQRVLVGLFVFFLLFPMVDFLFDIDPTPPMHENRPLTVFPGWDKMLLMPARTSQFLDDHAGWRNSIMLGRQRVMHELGRRASSPAVLWGKDGWLFYRENGLMNDHRGRIRLSLAELEQAARVLEGRRRVAEAAGASFLFVMVGDKHTIYPEFLPLGMEQSRGRTRADQLMDYLREKTTVPVLDLRPVFREQKGLGQLYMREDTHWTALGIWLSLGEVFRSFPEPWKDVPFPVWENIRLRDEERIGDLSMLLGIGSFVKETVGGMELEKSVLPPLVDRPRVVIYGDSFSKQWIPLAERLLTNVRFIDNPGFGPADWESFQPDVVVFEMVERFVDRLGKTYDVPGESGEPRMDAD